MPWFDFTVVFEGVDPLSDESMAAIEEHSATFEDDAPLEGATYVRGQAVGKAVFSLEAADHDAAIAVALTALREALPHIGISSFTPGRDPGPLDIL